MVAVVIWSSGIITQLHSTILSLFACPIPQTTTTAATAESQAAARLRLQRRVLLNRAVQEKMAAVSSSVLHICQKMTVQEKMRSLARLSFNTVAACAVCHFSFYFCDSVQYDQALTEAFTYVVFISTVLFAFMWYKITDKQFK